MTRPDSVSGDERIRLFCALVVPEEATKQLRAWQRDAFAEAGGARRLDEFHLTLAFLGHRPSGELEGIAAALHGAALAARPPLLSAARYRETRSVGMLVLHDEGSHATALAVDLHTRLQALGVYEPERRPWLPHVTVLRFRTAPRLRPPVPDLGVFSPSEAAVYHSVLRPGGAQYEILESFALGG